MISMNLDQLQCPCKDGQWKGKGREGNKEVTTQREVDEVIRKRRDSAKLYLRGGRRSIDDSGRGEEREPFRFRYIYFLAFNKIYYYAP